MRSTQARSARNSLLWGLAVFALLQLCFALVIEWRLPELRDPSYSVRIAALQRRLTSPRPAPRPKLVIMLGSSRTLYALRGSLVETELERQLGQPVIVFNLGSPAAQPTAYLLNFGRLLQDGIRPDLLLIELMPAYLDRPRTAGTTWIDAEQLEQRDLALLHRYQLPSAQELICNWWHGLPVPWYTCRLAILSEAIYRIQGISSMSWQHGCDPSGWLSGRPAVVAPEIRRHELNHASNEFVQALQSFELGGPNAEAIRRLVQESHREHIPVALVLMPEGPIFRSWYPEKSWRQVEEFMGEMTAQHHVPIINARDWVQEEDFSDSHHVLNGGTRVFTERLAREFLLPFLRGAEMPSP
jgi:hypothetical protein